MGDKLLDLSTPKVMGILNVTPDSFFDGNQHNTLDLALKRTEKMIDEGVDIIDIGGYSTRPNADDISEQEEIERILPTIKSIKKHFPSAIISLDTFRGNVAEIGIIEGVDIICAHVYHFPDRKVL